MLTTRCHRYIDVLVECSAFFLPDREDFYSLID